MPQTSSLDNFAFVRLDRVEKAKVLFLLEFVTFYIDERWAQENIAHLVLRVPIQNKWVCLCLDLCSECVRDPLFLLILTAI